MRKARPLWLWCGELKCLLKLLGSDFTERHQAAPRLVPQHKPYAPKALQGRYVTDLAHSGWNARQPVKGDTTAEMVHVVGADVGCEPAGDRNVSCRKGRPDEDSSARRAPTPFAQIDVAHRTAIRRLWRRAA